ncbi:MAG: hypothetical protein CMB99_15335 [Flavobacteriaceae bacterium]|nr:hypothetical protein [Flavobacteriaceae bacterium]|tara:strand:+ start:379528 stop:379818 length:291 start_codon:yes stop_codon:yes gene_type:complete
MGIINIGISILLILFALLVKYNPNLIAGYKFLPEEKKQEYPIHLLVNGFVILSILNLAIYFLLVNSSYHNYAPWSFLFVVSIGVVLISWMIQQKLK